MWIFSGHGFVDLVQDPRPEHNHELVIRTQVEANMTEFVRLLDEAAGQPHAVEQTYDGDLRFTTVATKETVAKVVSELVANIDYKKFKQSAVHFDLGAKSSYVVWLGPTDLQVTKLMREP